MFYKNSVILLVIFSFIVQNKSQEWDIAVVVNDQIELLTTNGTLIGTTAEHFSKLKALTFDNIRHQLVVSDMDLNYGNDTIFSVNLSKESEVIPIIQELPDDVQGLAIDPEEDILYWTDSKNKTINLAALNSTLFTKKDSDVLITFKNEIPFGIAVDVCKRHLYWTNIDISNPTIERSNLDGSNRTVIVGSDLKMPVGIAVDHYTDRLYWADSREGIYYRVESIGLAGQGRQIIFEGTHITPFSIAVDKFAIYWTDTNNNALWKILKADEDTSVPKNIHNFNEKPMGLVVRNSGIRYLPECSGLENLRKELNTSDDEHFTRLEEPLKYIECLNNGKLQGDICKCQRGYTGKYCEISLCYNFCLHGVCRLSTLGYPKCHCQFGFYGDRCNKDMCDNFCLNHGRCVSSPENSKVPKCQCENGFSGPRCEFKYNSTNICNDYCKGNRDISSEITSLCSCSKVSDLNGTSNEVHIENDSTNMFLKRLSDPWFLGLLIWLIISPLVMTIIIAYMCCIYRKKRPRIKKRIIVNKNVQPLTYRPQPAEQCEITIENCCNMNVCETPCFEPKGFKRHEDKKTLLGNMENGSEDIY